MTQVELICKAMKCDENDVPLLTNLYAGGSSKITPLEKKQ